MHVEWKVVHSITTEGLEFQLQQLQNQDWDIHTIKFISTYEQDSSNPNPSTQNMYGGGGQNIYYHPPATTVMRTKSGMWTIVAYRATPEI